MTSRRIGLFFCKDNCCCSETEGRCTVPYGAEPPVKLAEWNIVHRLTPLEGRECRAVSIDMPVVGDERYVMTGLRASYDVLPRELYLKAGKGAEILYWDKNTKFCGVCGAPMKLHTDISKRCTNCGKEVWPQLATAIIVLVRRGDSILLVHAHNLRGKYYGLVAGFVETGDARRMCAPRIDGRNWRTCGEYPIFRQPTVALSLRIDDWFLCGLCGGRLTFAT